MEYKVQITDEAGNIRQYNVSRSSSSEEKSLIVIQKYKL